MYTDDDEKQRVQRTRAEAVIAFTAKRYASKKRRIEELDYWRDFYQSIPWQIAIDLLEAQMIAWGQAEQEENMALYASYTQEMNHYYVDRYKPEWEDEDYQRYGYLRAYARARYAIRFKTLAGALVYLERYLADWVRYLHSPPMRECVPSEKNFLCAYFGRLQLIMDQMRMLL